jgi:hypothetical protein
MKQILLAAAFLLVPLPVSGQCMDQMLKISSQGVIFVKQEQMYCRAGPPLDSVETIDDSNVSYGIGTSIDRSALPVEVAYFDAAYNSTSVTLKWKTRDERNVDLFEVWHSGKIIATAMPKGGGVYKVPIARDRFGYGKKTIKLAEQTPSGRQKITETKVRLPVGGRVNVTKVHPNPIRGNGSFSIAVREGQTVRFEIFDTAGRKVGVVQQELPSEAKRKIQLNGVRLASGKYFIKVIGENFRLTRRFTVLR